MNEPYTEVLLRIRIHPRTQCAVHTRDTSTLLRFRLDRVFLVCWLALAYI